jgi:hypothetical protein
MPIDLSDSPTCPRPTFEEFVAQLVNHPVQRSISEALLFERAKGLINNREEMLHHLSPTMSTLPETMEETLQRLVDPPADQSALLTMLADIEQAAAFLPTIDEYKKYIEYINDARNGQRNPDLAKVRPSLIRDVVDFNDPLLSEMEPSQAAQFLDGQLRSAWAAAETSAKIARDVYQKANLDTKRLQERFQEFENEQSMRQLLTAQHQKLLTNINDLSSNVRGIKITTDRIIQDVHNVISTEDSWTNL